MAVSVGLGNGQTIISRIKLSEEQLGFLDQFASEEAACIGTGRPTLAAYPLPNAAEFQRDETQEEPNSFARSKAKLLVLCRDRDVEADAAALARELVVSLPSWKVVNELETEEPGANVIRYAQGLVRESDTILLILGPSGLQHTAFGRDGSPGREGLYEAALRTALSSEVHIIPVLLAGAKRLDPADLPPEMQEIALRNPIDLTEGDEEKQMMRLIRYLEQRSVNKRSHGFRMAIDVI